MLDTEIDGVVYEQWDDSRVYLCKKPPFNFTKSWLRFAQYVKSIFDRL